MSGLNKVMLIGRLGKPPALRWLESGQAMCTLSLATTERFKDASGQTRERTEWHRVVLWRELAEIADRHLDVGAQVYIEGKLRSRSWQDATGTTHKSTEIVGERLEMLMAAEPTRDATEQAKGPHPMDSASLPF